MDSSVAADATPATVTPVANTDPMEARREARRRRILENSSNRLAKISGIEGQPTAVPSPPTAIVHPDPEMERDIFEPQQRRQFADPMQQLFSSGAFGAGSFGGGRTGTQQSNDMFASMLASMTSGGGPGGNDPFAMFQGLSDASTLDAPRLFGGVNQSQPTGSTAPTSAQPISLLVRLLRSKLHIATIGVLTYLLATNDLMFRSHVFTLFLLWEFVELFVLKPYEKDRSSYLGIVFMVSGIPSEHSSVVMRWLSQIRRVLKDLAIFVFFFVLAHLVWQRLVIGESLAFILNVDGGDAAADLQREAFQQSYVRPSQVVLDEEVDFEF